MWGDWAGILNGVFKGGGGTTIIWRYKKKLLWWGEGVGVAGGPKPPLPERLADGRRPTLPPPAPSPNFEMKTWLKVSFWETLYGVFAEEDLVSVNLNIV